MASLFTRIIEGEIPGRFIWRDEQCVAFLTIGPIRPGHALVVPIEEVDHWLDLSPDLAVHLFAVAQVIGQAQMADDDSAEHGPNGLHELTFERETLNPALGARGSSLLVDSGALIRRAAIDSVEVGDEVPIEAQAYWSMGLMSEGWKVVAATGDAFTLPPWR